MTNKFGYKLQDYPLSISLLNIFGLTFIMLHCCCIFTGVLYHLDGAFVIIPNFILSMLMSVTCCALYACKLNRKVLYNFYDQLYGISLTVFMFFGMMYLFGGEYGYYIYGIISILTILPLQGIYYKVRDKYKSKRSGIPPIPLVYNVGVIGKKVWSVFVPSLISFAAVSLLVSFVDIENLGLSIVAIIFFPPIWLLSVFLYGAGFNRHFFDSRSSQIAFSVIYAISFLIVIKWQQGYNYDYEHYNYMIDFFSYIPSTIFFIAQGLYFRLKKDHPDPISNPEDFK